jgi:AraC family transcriptional regulator, transcriptional activator FtrA
MPATPPTPAFTAQARPKTTPSAPNSTERHGNGSTAPNDARLHQPHRYEQHDAVFPMRVGILVFPGTRLYDLAAAVEVFDTAATSRGRNPANDLTVLTTTDDLTPPVSDVRTRRFTTEATSHDLLVIPGFTTPPESIPTPSAPDIRKLQAAHRQGTHIASLCTGAFWLASTGLLNGKVAVTHWKHCDTLASMHPATTVKTNMLHTCQDRIWTSAGVSAGIDLCLELVRHFEGAATANEVTRTLVLHAQRPGGQWQYMPPAYRTTPCPDPISILQHDVRLNPAGTWTSTLIARRLGISIRTLERRFRSTINTTPKAWLTEQRLDCVRELLETTHWA